MPSAATIGAATPKCPAFRYVGSDAVPCDTPMWWDDALKSWSCPRHPHLEVRPQKLGETALAPKGVRDRRISER